jgi:hypothetical protein
MGANRTLAVVAGILFIIATVANVIGVALVSSILSAPDYLNQIAANETTVLVSALFLFIGGLACPGIALALYPVLRPHDEGLALGSVAFRTIEGGLYVLVVVGQLVLVSLSREATTAAAPSAAYQVPGDLVKSARDWLAPVAVLTFGLGALLYYWVFFDSRLIPRWLSGWGLVGIVLVMASAVLVMLRVIDNFSTTQVALAAPIAVQEMVLAVWLIAKGFSQPGAAAERGGERQALRAA